MRAGFVIYSMDSIGGTERTACAVVNALAAETGPGKIFLIEDFSACPAGFVPDSAVGRSVLLGHRPASLIRSWPRLVFALWREICRLKLDVVVAVESTHALYVVPAARLAGVRCVVWEHFNRSVDLGKRNRRRGRAIADRLADDVVTLTRRDARMWQAAGCRARVTCIPNMAPDPMPGLYDPAARTVLSLGRLTAQKGYDVLLRAWALVEQDPRSEGWSLKICGDGPDRAALEEQAASLSHVRLEPAQGDVIPLFRSAGMYVLSSRFEGLPMVLLEACAAGVPVVATDCLTGPAEVIVPGETGLLVPPEDPAALAAALLEMMDSRDRRSRFSAASLRRAEEFSRASVTARWRSLLGV